MLQHLKGIVCLGQGKRLGRRIVTGQRRSVQGWNSHLPGVGGDTPQVVLQKKMLLVIDVEVRALNDMAWPLSWTNSQHSLEALERALRLSARQQDPLPHARTRARCFALHPWQRWNPQDAEEFRNAFAEIRNADDRRRMLAPYFFDCGFIFSADDLYT